MVLNLGSTEEQSLRRGGQYTPDSSCKVVLTGPARPPLAADDHITLLSQSVLLAGALSSQRMTVVIVRCVISVEIF